MRSSVPSTDITITKELTSPAVNARKSPLLYKDAPFVILDEPTAALDPIAEAAVYENFNILVKDKTAVFISHRLSSCRFCEYIVVFDHGELIQEGSHDMLVSDENGKYYELWHAQAQYYLKNSVL